MEGSRKNFLKNRSNPQFKKKGGARKGKVHNSAQEQSPENYHSTETVYRILCQSKRIGSIIGKGGNIVKALREQTRAKITVADSIAGSDERLIIISSPSERITKRPNAGNSGEHPKPNEEYNVMEPHCAAQDALLKIHDRIVGEDIGQLENHDGNETVVIARLLVPNNIIGCLLGRKGDIIQRLRSETGANIRVLGRENLPDCAMSTDELVHISGKPTIAKKALYEVSTLLFQNPRKYNLPLTYPMVNSQGFPSPGCPMSHMLLAGNSSWLKHVTDSDDIPPTPWKGGYERYPSAFGPADFDPVPPLNSREVPSQFTLKILCPAEKIGVIIGKGGFNVRHLEQETGARIHVDNVSAKTDERVICVSSVEALSDQRSRTIDAILQLQNRTSEQLEKGIIVTRLLVPSSKVGCILGQGGQVINEMRRRTHADIRVFPKEDKPKCASRDEELVQISGNLGVVKNALAEIASRLRTRYLHDVNAGAEPASLMPVTKYGPDRNLAGIGLPVSRVIGAGSSGRFEYLESSVREHDPLSYPGPPRGRGYLDADYAMEARISNDAVRPVTGIRAINVSESSVREHEGLGYPGPPRSTGYLDANYAMEAGISNNDIGSMMGTRGIQLKEVARARVNIGHYPGDPDFASSGHFNAARSTYQAFASSSGPDSNPQHGAYGSYETQRGSYASMNSQVPYQNLSPQQAAHQNPYTQPAPYRNPRAPGSYQY